MVNPVDEKCPLCDGSGWVDRCHQHQILFCESCLDSNWVACTYCDQTGVVKGSVIIKNTDQSSIGFKPMSSSMSKCSGCNTTKPAVYWCNSESAMLCTECSNASWQRKWNAETFKVNLDEYFKVGKPEAPKLPEPSGTVSPT